jgi:hypothetical protein
METSAVNAPHVDEVDERFEADDFFGAPEEVEQVEQVEEPAQGPMPVLEADQAAEPPKQRGRQKAAVSTSGQIEREYIVFQRVVLTKDTLEALLAEVESGIPAREVFWELHRATARMDKMAVGAAYAENRKALGDRCELAVVSARAFKRRYVKPEHVPVARRISIT